MTARELPPMPPRQRALTLGQAKARNTTGRTPAPPPPPESPTPGDCPLCGHEGPTGHRCTACHRAPYQPRY